MHTFAGGPRLQLKVNLGVYSIGYTVYSWSGHSDSDLLSIVYAYECD